MILSSLLGRTHSDFPYLRVIGHLEQFKGYKTIEVINIRKVSSPYELYYHILHTIYDTLVYERGPVRP
jgi:hypothetical protein